jgi:GABA(A) receptor-associated protein
MNSYNYKGEFKQKYLFKDRLAESSRILVKYPDRIPIIVEQERNSSIPLLDKRKYLVPDDMTVGQFMYVIRKRLHVKSEIALYMFFGNTIAPTHTQIGTVYKDGKDHDKFLYVVIGAEKTFGGVNFK